MPERCASSPGPTADEGGASKTKDRLLANQPYLKYDEFAAKYKANGGTSK